MKVLFTILFFLSTLTLCGQINDADAFFNGNYDKMFIHKHRIKQVTVNTYINSNKSSRHLFDFDQAGFLSKQTIFDGDGKKVNEYIFTYNKQGDQIKRKNIAYDLNKTNTVAFKRTYKGQQLVQETSSEQPSVTKHIYNVKGQKIRSVTFMGVDTNSAKRVCDYMYNTKGQLTGSKEAFVNNDGSTPFNMGATEYRYNATGNVVAVVREGKANYEFGYDTTDLLKSKKTIMPKDLDGTIILDEYSYSFWN